MSDAPPVDAPADTTNDAPEAKGDTPDSAAEIAKWKEMARKHEQRAKENAGAAKELEQLRAASMSEQEKAVAAALEQGRTEARTETLRTVGSRLVDAEVKAAAAGRSVDVEALLEGLDRSRFLDDDGEPKVAEIAAWVERIAPAQSPIVKTVDLGQGNRGAGTSAIALNDPLLKDLVTKVGPPRQ